MAWHVSEAAVGAVLLVEMHDQDGGVRFIGRLPGRRGGIGNRKVWTATRSNDQELARNVVRELGVCATSSWPLIVAMI
jgi:hypothetical protein